MAGIESIVPILPETALIISVAITSMLIILMTVVSYAKKDEHEKIELPV